MKAMVLGEERLHEFAPTRPDLAEAWKFFKYFTYPANPASDSL